MSKAPRPRSGFAVLLDQPLFRLLAINLLGGVALAALLVGGLLAINPMGLRTLIFADNSPGVGLALLLFGFAVTFGSTMMGSAIMALHQAENDRDTGKRQPVTVTVASNSRRR